MPRDTEYESGGRHKKHKPVPIAPPGSSSTVGSSGGSGSGGGGRGSGGAGSSSSSASSSSSSSSSGGGGDGRHKAGLRYASQAANLEGQAQALLHALNQDFQQALHIKLGNVERVYGEQKDVLLEGYHDRVQSLKGSVADNEKAHASQTVAAAQNRSRERQNALTEAMTQGAGESDAMQAQLMSLRNWGANQGEVQRTLFDTMRSINASLNDLNVDTKSALVNLRTQADADKEALYTNFYNQKSETYTQLGNVRGQQADYRDMAHEMGVGPGGKAGAAKSAFMHASNELGKAYRTPRLPKAIRNWDGRGDFKVERHTGTSMLAAAPSVDLGQRPEGATLRKWDQ